MLVTACYPGPVVGNAVTRTVVVNGAAPGAGPGAGAVGSGPVAGDSVATRQGAY